MTVQERIWGTIKFLREELRDLKRCQVQYFTLAITATSALLGLASTLAGPGLRGLAFLTPLGLLLPCWMIFFDKATTITRIVGYQRVLEYLLTAPPQQHSWFLGYEMALGRFREAQDGGKLKVGPGTYKPGLFRVVCLSTRHRFWMLNWYTFCALSVLCCWLGYNFLEDRTFDLRFPFLKTYITLWERDFGTFAFLLVLLVAVYTFVVVVQLVRGPHSFDGNASAWEKVWEMAKEETLIAKRKGRGND